MVTVYRFRAFDPDTNEWVVQLSKATKDYIEMIGGRIIDGTAENVDPATLDPVGQLVPNQQGR
jgi:hypothetical protein